MLVSFYGQLPDSYPVLVSGGAVPALRPVGRDHHKRAEGRDGELLAEFRLDDGHEREAALAPDRRQALGQVNTEKSLDVGEVVANQEFFVRVVFKLAVEES